MVTICTQHIPRDSKHLQKLDKKDIKLISCKPKLAKHSFKFTSCGQQVCDMHISNFVCMAVWWLIVCMAVRWPNVPIPLDKKLLGTNTLDKLIQGT